MTAIQSTSRRRARFQPGFLQTPFITSNTLMRTRSILQQPQAGLPSIRLDHKAERKPEPLAPSTFCRFAKSTGPRRILGMHFSSGTYSNDPDPIIPLQRVAEIGAAHSRACAISPDSTLARWLCCVARMVRRSRRCRCVSLGDGARHAARRARSMAASDSALASRDCRRPILRICNSHHSDVGNDLGHAWGLERIKQHR